MLGYSYLSIFIVIFKYPHHHIPIIACFQFEPHILIVSKEHDLELWPRVHLDIIFDNDHDLFNVPLFNKYIAIKVIYFH